MAVEIKRKFYFTQTSELNTIPLREGNWIALSDSDCMYYDVGNPAGSGSNVERREISGRLDFVGTLPDSGDENILYILNTGAVLIGTDQPYYELYCWENEAWQKIANNSNDVNVTSFVRTDATQYYITGSELSTTSTGSLVKRSDVYVATDGKIRANGFTGGFADNATNATNATNAVSAQTAVKDAEDNVISEYIKTIVPSDSSRQVSLIKGDGTSTNINTYVPPVMNTTQAGLVPTIPQDTTKNVLYRDGWGELDVSGLTADKAIHDGDNQTITSTYIKNISFNNSNRTLTFTYGDNNSDTTNISDTTYSDYSGPGNGHGLVPASASGDAERYLKVNGTWSTIPALSGATGSADGIAGLVPTPTTSDVDHFLKGDGSWADTPYPDVFDGTNDGLVPQPASADKFLSSDGGWEDLPEFVGTDGIDPGTAGVVPAPLAADVGKFLNSDGTWGVVPDMTGSSTVVDGTAGLVPAPLIADTDKFLKGDGTWAAPSVARFTQSTDGAVPAPYTAAPDSHLCANGSWAEPVLNTTGATDIGSDTYTFHDTFTGDGTTTVYNLSYTPNLGSLTVIVDGVVSSDYTLASNTITFNTAPTSGDAIVAAYVAPLGLAKLYFVGAPEQNTSVVTYTNSNLYIQDGKLYNNGSEIASTLVTDSSFTPAAGLTVSAKQYGRQYSITIDGTAGTSVSVGGDVATTTKTFNKVYSVGVVGSNLAMFKLDGSSVTCDTAINSNDDVQVTFTAFA